MALHQGEGSLTLEPEHDSVREARRFVASILAELGCEAQADDAALLTSELATNAVIHARTSYVVVVKVGGGTIRIEVMDASPAPVHRRHFSATSGTGRGIGLVSGMAHAWGIDESGHGKTVWFELDSRDAVSTASPSSDSRGRPEPDPDVDLDAILAELGIDGDHAGDGPRARRVLVPA
jgi:anti-sigma regulatory factor (Ser/Thr protein kinase)